MAQVTKVEELKLEYQIEPPRVKPKGKRCVYYQDEICLAPKIRFEVCKSCYRINPRYIVRNLFERIKALAIFLKSLYH